MENGVASKLNRVKLKDLFKLWKTCFDSVGHKFEVFTIMRASTHEEILFYMSHISCSSNLQFCFNAQPISLLYSIINSRILETQHSCSLQCWNGKYPCIKGFIMSPLPVCNSKITQIPYKNTWLVKTTPPSLYVIYEHSHMMPVTVFFFQTHVVFIDTLNISILWDCLYHYIHERHLKIIINFILMEDKPKWTKLL